MRRFKTAERIEVSKVLSSYKLIPNSRLCFFAAFHHSTIHRALFLADSSSCMNTAELFEIIASAGHVGRSYADNTHMLQSFSRTSASVLAQRFTSWVELIGTRMRSNRLRMDVDKTQLVWLGTRKQRAKLTNTELPLSSALVKPSSTVWSASSSTVS